VKILLLSSSYLPRIGGLERVVHELARQFQRRGHIVHVLTNRYPWSLPSKEVIEGVSVTRLFFLLPHWRQLRIGRLDLFLAGIAVAPVTAVRLCVHIVSMKPDVVNLHYLGDPAAFILFARWLLRFRLVVSFHGADVEIEPRRSSFNRWLFERTIRAAERITFCSRALMTAAATICTFDNAKGIIILNGVDVDLFARATPHIRARSYFFAVGRLEYAKGFDLLLDAFAMATLDREDVDLLIAGEGPQMKDLLEMAERYRIASRVEFAGTCSSERVASMMKGSVCTIIPSRREPFGIVGLEARVSGAKIISANVGGLPEALEVASVRWVASESADELAAALKKALAVRPDRHRSETVVPDLRLAKVSWSSRAEEYLSVYDL
jgi:glycogen synthase